MYDELVMKIIEQVQLHPALYNKSNPNYMRTTYKNNVWKIIAESLRENGFVVNSESCKKRWKTVRDRYNKLRKIPPGGDECDEQSTWAYFHAMKFVEECEEDNEARSNSGSSLLPFPSNSTASESDEEQEEPLTKRPKIKQEEAEPLNEIIETGIPVEIPNSDLHSGDFLLHPHPTDDCDMFSGAIASTLRRLPLQTREWAKLEIHRMLYELEFGEPHERGQPKKN